MITLIQACHIVQEEHPDMKIRKIIERENEWVILIEDKITGETPDIGGPPKINKETGKSGIFFPPRDGWDLKGRQIEIPKQFK